MFKEKFVELNNETNSKDTSVLFVKPTVVLLFSTPLYMVKLAGRTCIGKTDLNYKHNSSENIINYVKKIVERNELSVVEHINFTFLISNITRSLLQEVVRHRIASYSVKSTRYTLKNSLKQISDFFKKEKKPIERINFISRYFRIDLETKFSILRIVEIMVYMYDSGMDLNAIKSILPECLLTDMVMTINARSLLNLFSLRLSSKAYTQFKELASLMFLAIPEEYRKALFFEIEEKFKDVIFSYYKKGGF